MNAQKKKKNFSSLMLFQFCCIKFPWVVNDSCSRIQGLKGWGDFGSNFPLWNLQKPFKGRAKLVYPELVCLSACLPPCPKFLSLLTTCPPSLCLHLCPAGLQILYTLLQNVTQEEAAAQSFYQTYFCDILQHILSVVTDTSHTAGEPPRQLSQIC